MIDLDKISAKAQEYQKTLYESVTYEPYEEDNHKKYDKVACLAWLSFCLDGLDEKEQEIMLRMRVEEFVYGIFMSNRVRKNLHVVENVKITAIGTEKNAFCITFFGWAHC